MLIFTRLLSQLVFYDLDQNRTDDLLLRRQSLYPAELRDQNNQLLDYLILYFTMDNSFWNGPAREFC